MLFFTPLQVLAQEDEWRIYATEDFDYYYLHHDFKEAELLDPVFEKELFLLQNDLNYHLNNKVAIFLYNTDEQYQRLQGHLPGYKGSQAGLVAVRSARIYLNLRQDPHEMIRSFRSQSTRVLYHEMMFGGSLQDQIRSANLLYMPDWVVAGLECYMGDRWSAETDNQWRMVYEQYGLKQFNRIPEKYNHLKGASFFKFLEDEYGNTAVSNVLYMARLTRKFHSALYYAFQKSSVELYREWRAYYQFAYTLDQRKRIPIQGERFAQDELLDLHLIDAAHYLVLQQFGNKTVLEAWNAEGKQNELYQLKSNQHALRNFIGSIGVFKDSYYLVVQEGEIYQLILIEKGQVKTYPLELDFIRQVFVEKDELYLLEAALEKSTLYRWQAGMLSKVQRFDHYVSEVIHASEGWIIKEHPLKALPVLKKYTQHDTQLLFKPNYQFRQLIVSEGYMYFNSNGNGVFNGTRLALQRGQVEYLTDYRSDIAFHQLTNGTLAEYVLQLDQSALFITEAYEHDDYFIYDSLEPTYFHVRRPHDGASVDPDAYVPEQDSIPNYTFQSPVLPDMDFTLSNYDSLKMEAELSRTRQAAFSSAPDKYKTREVMVQLYNELSDGGALAYGNSIDRYLPKRMGIRFSGSIGNQYNDQRLSISYLAFRLAMYERDVQIKYTNNRHRFPFELGASHRQRIQLLSELDVNKDRNYGAFASWVPWKSKHLQLVHQLSYRLDDQTHLGVDLKPVVESMSFKQQWSNHFILKYKRPVAKPSLWKFQGALRVTPYVLLENELQSGLNISTQWQTFKSIRSWMQFSGKVQAGMSMGERPTFYVLGGTSSDLRASLVNRNFSTYKQPAYFQMVYGIRGFDPNYRNGNTFGLANAELSLQLIRLLSPRPLYSEFFDQLSLVFFGDIGSSMYGNSIYDDANALNTRTIETPGSSYSIEVRNIKNPTIGSLGFGLHSYLYSYFIRADLAYGIENGGFRAPMLHVSLGHFLQ